MASAGPRNSLGLLGCETRRRKVVEFGETGVAAPDDAVYGLGITNTSQVVVDGRIMLTRADTTGSSCTACLILFFDSLDETLEHVDVMELSDGGPFFQVLFRKSSADVSLW